MIYINKKVQNFMQLRRLIDIRSAELEKKAAYCGELGSQPTHAGGWLRRRALVKISSKSKSITIRESVVCSYQVSDSLPFGLPFFIL